MFSCHMNLMSLYSAEVPRIRTKKLSSLTTTGIENRDDMHLMLVSRVSIIFTIIGVTSDTADI